MTGAGQPVSQHAVPAPLAGVWLVIALSVVAAANVWPMDLVSIDAWPPRLLQMIRQGVDVGTVRAVIVWLALGGLAAVTFAGLRQWPSRVLCALGIATIALLIEAVQVTAAARHASLTDGLLAALAGSGPLLIWQPASFALGRWLWSLSGLALISALLLFPWIGTTAATRQPLANWSDGFPLIAGAEGNGERAWQGSIGDLTLYARPLGRDALAILSAETSSNRDAGLDDRLGAIFSTRLDGAVPGAAAPLVSARETDAMIDVMQAGGGFSAILEAQPASTYQTGQPRLLTLSPDPYRRNFTIGQEGADLFIRVRTPWSGTNGTRQGLSEWPNVFAAEGPRTIAMSYDGDVVHVFVNGQAAGGPVTLYRSRLDLRHDGPAGDLALMALICGACGALAGVIAPTIASWLAAGTVGPGLAVQVGLAFASGSVWTILLAAVGVGAVFAGLGLARLSRQTLAVDAVSPSWRRA